MISQAIERIAGAVCLLTVAASAAYFAYDSHRTQEEVRSAIANFGAVGQSMRDDLEAVNRPCGGGKPCGLLAELGKATIKVGDIAVTTQRQVAQSSKLVNVASQSLAQTSQSIATVAAAGTTVAVQASETFQTARSAIRDLQPLERALAEDSIALHQTILDTNQLIANPDIPETIGNVRATTKEMALISNDLHVWSHPVLNPDPCLTSKCRWGRALGKIGGYLSIGAQAETFGSFWKPLPVRLSK